MDEEVKMRESRLESGVADRIGFPFVVLALGLQIMRRSAAPAAPA
jgi:hypothetical protein